MPSHIGPHPTLKISSIAPTYQLPLLFAATSSDLGITVLPPPHLRRNKTSNQESQNKMASIQKKLFSFNTKLVPSATRLKRF
uniref:Uncharacterized protein n=1 Tax=Medicago truncatula TaxID=3880 RepID=I3SXC3_MEDTR|nr:unknown [Medicago truncatula]